MRAILLTAKPLLLALVSTGLAILAFVVLSGAGYAMEPSLIAALILAGSLNIYGLAALNGEAFLPTSTGSVGELSP